MERLIGFLEHENVVRGVRSEAMPVHLVGAQGLGVLLGIEDRLVVAGPRHASGDVSDHVVEKLAGPEGLEINVVDAAAFRVDRVREKVVVDAHTGDVQREILVTFGQGVPVREDFLVSVERAAFAAVDRVLFALFEAVVIVEIVFAVGNRAVIGIESPFDFFEERLLELFGVGHHRARVLVLRLEVGDDLGVFALVEPVVRILADVAVCFELPRDFFRDGGRGHLVIGCGLEHETGFGDRLDLGSRVEERKVLVVDPEIEKIAVVGASRITRLPGRVRGNGVVPIRRSEDDAEAWTSGLVVSRPCVVERGIVPALWRRADIEHRARVIVDCGAQRMVDENVLELFWSVSPVQPVRAEPFDEVGDAFRQALTQDLVAARDRIIAEAPVGGDEPVDDALLVHPRDECTSFFRNHGVPHVLEKAPLEADIDGRSGRALIENEVPIGERNRCFLIERARELDVLEQGHNRSRRDRKLIMLELHHVHDREPAPGR